MPKLKVTKPFKYSPNGVHVVEYGPGEHEVSERCAEVAVAEGWGQKVKAANPRAESRYAVADKR